MNRKLTFPEGEPLINFDDLDRNNIANLAALTASFRAYGDNYIIQGVKGTTSITAGYIMLDGEIVQVDAHTKTSTHFVKVVTYDAGGDKTFNDSTPRQTWQINRATITAGSGNLAYSGAPRLKMPLEIDIGDWNMDATTTKNVAHGLSATEWKTARIKNITIRNDADDNYTLLDGVSGSISPPQGGGLIGYGSVNFQLTRFAAGIFDNTNYDATSYNRGWIYLEYIPD